jgi:alkylglycerol monooxygenase
MTGVFFFVFDHVHKNFGLFKINAGVITWIALFLLTDLVWYWYHRLAHEINLFWAAHVVHHQSEDFNYTVSARITVFQAVIRGLFWCVLPLLGFPALMVTALLLVHGLYPFFIHTQAMGKWVIFEKFMVTPTHHGIHHASNPEYLDKNYGDVLIIWDKLFGTFAKERKEITIEYGLTKQLKSHSFLWQHFHFPLEVFMNFKYAKGWRNKWKAIFGKPDGLDPRYRSILERKFLNVQPHRKPTLAMRQYVTAQTIFSLVLLFIVVLFEHYFSGLQLFLLSAFIVTSLINSGAILDQRRWIFFLEFLRALIVMIEIGLIYRNNWTLGCLIALLLIMIWYFRPIQRKYIQVLYNK